MAKRQIKRHCLLNGCYYTEFAVHPENWDKAGANANCEWYFTYRFFDPLFADKKPYGKQIQVKGMNVETGLMAKRQSMSEFLKNERYRLEVGCFNPFTKRNMRPPDDFGTMDIPPDLPIQEALYRACEKLKDKIEPSTHDDAKLVLNSANKAILQLKYGTIQIGTVKRAHVRRILEQIGINKGKTWTNNNFNHHRAYLSMLFSELEQWDAIEYNPCDKITKLKVVKKKPEVLTDTQRIAVYNYLREKNFRFWLLMNIFYLAGCRTTEIMRVQVKHVDLVNQKFTVLTKKGTNYREVEYTITDAAVPFWQMALKNGDNEVLPDDYVFTWKLLPSATPICSKQVGRRWKHWVKNKLNKDLGINITANWYRLKHLHSTELVTQHGLSMAADFNNESKQMISQVYDVLADNRKHEIKKRSKVKFVQ